MQQQFRENDRPYPDRQNEVSERSEHPEWLPYIEYEELKSEPLPDEPVGEDRTAWPSGDTATAILNMVRVSSSVLLGVMAIILLGYLLAQVVVWVCTGIVRMWVAFKLWAWETGTVWGIAGVIVLYTTYYLIRRMPVSKNRKRKRPGADVVPFDFGPGTGNVPTQTNTSGHSTIIQNFYLHQDNRQNES